MRRDGGGRARRRRDRGRRHLGFFSQILNSGRNFGVVFRQSKIDVRTIQKDAIFIQILTEKLLQRRRFDDIEADGAAKCGCAPMLGTANRIRHQTC